MPVPNSPSSVVSLHRPLNSALIGSRQEEERGPAEPAVKSEARPGIDFTEVVRANLHAAAQHAILGHEGASFRECSRPSCRNASNLIPYPVVVEGNVTDADLEEIFQRLVPAAMEDAASRPSPVPVAPEPLNEPAFIA